MIFVVIVVWLCATISRFNYNTMLALESVKYLDYIPETKTFGTLYLRFLFQVELSFTLQ